ncbi:band 3 anion transport protein isoform X3 [Galleria mellonella]|uniref:Anion exchange protein n=1 Tax=Galleria mellonella TaxID=7137 RepID=A0A6J1WSI4_GALME|nr:band 3 anion transport protein isoform X3 [Galleria mellonella]
MANEERNPPRAPAVPDSCQVAGEDEVQLDDEMERVVWGEGEQRLPGGAGGAGADPRRDHAAPHPPHPPPPYTTSADETGSPERSQASTGSGAHVSAGSEPQQMSGGWSGSGSGSASAGSPASRVQFDAERDQRAEHAAPPLDDDADSERRAQRNERHLHTHKPRKYSLQEGGRAVPGSADSGNADSSGGGGYGGGGGGGGQRRVSIAPGEEPLPEVDRDDLHSHRSDDPRALRRHRIQPHKGSTVHVGRKDGGDKVQTILPDSTYKKMYDHSPHSVFVQLDELLETEQGDAEWKETARWIKYEEDVEEGSARWGRPHVASLSFHSLLNLRRCLETGVVLLDLNEKDLPGVAYRVVESMVSEELIEEDDKPVVMRSLLLRHRHVDERLGFRFSITGRKHSSYTSLQNLAEHRRRRSSYALPAATLQKKTSMGGADLREVEYLTAVALADGSQDELRRANDSIRKRIPEDAEATTVLVGAVGFLDQPTIAFVRLAQGILMPSITEVPIPVRFMFILLGPSGADLDYHEVGRSISTLMSNPSFHSIAYKADDRRELLSAINEFLDDSIVLPPGDWERQALLPIDELKAKSQMIRRRKQNALEKKRAASEVETPASDEKKALIEAEKGSPPKEPDDPLSRTGRLFGGVIRDIKRRYPYYKSDFIDALNGQCAAATIFMYFAALSSAITFGGLLADKTYGAIGISETLVFTCVGGLVFGLLSGQPLMITGATGPLLLLDESLANFCHSYGFDFLAARMYCGLWMIIIALCVASIEGSVAVKKITRFTEDIFAFLISLIFISEPITSTINVYRSHPLGVDYCQYNNVSVVDSTPVPDLSINGTLLESNATLPRAAAPAKAGHMPPQPNTALFCTMLTLSTFIIAYYLRIFRNGKFLGRSARRALGDFGVPIAIVLMVGVSCVVPVWTETLRVPAGLSPTAPRSWFVPLNPGLATIPLWASLAMVLPALMVYIIVFMETHIAELIVDKPERGLKKGSGFHMDIVIMSLVNALCGMFGAPWQCVATVRSVSHVSALTVMSTTHAPGDKPHIVEVKEQRLTGLLVAVLVGISVLASNWLRLVPMAVLFGVFLYMGISALGGIQFWDRCILLFKPVKHHPQVPYVRRVPTMKMHLFTLIQAAGLALLYAIKSSRVSLALPFFLVMMVPLRLSLAYIFTPLQLRALDGAQKEIDKDDEPDFYEEAPLPG